MRLGGMVVGGLRRWRRSAPRPWAARTWSRPRRALPVATPSSVAGSRRQPLERRARARDRAAPCASAPPACALRDEAVAVVRRRARSVSRLGQVRRQRRHRLGQRQADDAEHRLARPASGGRRRRRRASIAARIRCWLSTSVPSTSKTTSRGAVMAPRLAGRAARASAEARSSQSAANGRAAVRLGAADQHVVPAGAAGSGRTRARGGAQPALGAVAGDGVADLLRAGVADADRRPAPRRRRGGGPAASGRGATGGGRGRRRGSRRGGRASIAGGAGAGLPGRRPCAAGVRPTGACGRARGAG